MSDTESAATQTHVFLLHSNGSFAWIDANAPRDGNVEEHLGESVWKRCEPQDQDHLRDELAGLMMDQKDELCTEVRSIHGERILVSMYRLPVVQQAQHAVVGWFRRLSDDILVLTDREREVLVLICEELTTEQIASHLSIAPTTVDSHRQNIARKLNTKTVAGQVRAAIRGGLIEA